MLFPSGKLKAKMDKNMTHRMDKVGSDTRGAKDQLLVPTGCKTGKTNLSIPWIDSKKTYDSGPHMGTEYLGDV